MTLGETITVINKSGKIVSSVRLHPYVDITLILRANNSLQSKHIVNVWKEARSAYRERKAEIKALRDADLEEKRARHLLKAATLNDDTRSRASRPHTHRSKSYHHKAPSERGHRDDDRHEKSPRNRSLDRIDEEPPRKELIRRHTDFPDHELAPRKVSRSKSEPYIDMDLAYGELPPPLPIKKYEDEFELKNKMSKLTVLLDEANCLQHSVTAMIESLQKNPDALAAVALTLAEISNIVTKMAPGALTALKGSFPAVMALLASPQFMIAAGVGVGVTIVALGGYKIIKKIQAKPEEKELEAPMQLDELRTDELSRIELWRRGIADVQAASVGTSVDGELITPGASRFFVEEGVLDADDVKSRASRKSHKTKSKAPKSVASSHRSSKSKSKSKSDSKEKSSKEKSSRRREPSGLRMLFAH